MSGHFWVGHVVVSRYLRIDRLPSDPKHATDASADRHSPLLTAYGFPVYGDDWRHCSVPATRKVVFEQWPDQAGVDRWPAVVARK